MTETNATLEKDTAPTAGLGTVRELPVIRDSADCRRSEDRERLAHDVLDLLNRIHDVPTAIRRILLLFKNGTGFEAVGIRLREGKDFPYYVHDGFPDDFLATENTLIVRKLDGSAAINKDGELSLECMCGLVISGRTDPASPLFTAGGSFWTNNSLSLLDIPAEKDPRTNPRNRCVQEGFLSVALIPLRSDNEIIGLLHFNDHRPNLLTLEMIHMLERMATSIGLALARQQAETALRESESRFRALAEHSVDTIMQFDRLHRHLYVNPIVKLMTGIAPESFIGKTHRELGFPDALCTLWEDAIGRTFDTGTVNRIEFMLPSGIWIDWQLAPEIDAQGVVSTVLAVARDITERKQAQKALELSNETLRQRNNELKDFYHIVSHELKTPLTSAREFTSILLDGIAGPLTEDQKKYLQMVRESCDQLQFCVSDLLDATRLETGKLEVNTVDTSVQALVAGVVGSMIPAMRAKGVELRSEIGPELVDVPLDERRINQVCLNLLNNALKFTPAGGVVTVRVGIDPHNPDLIRFSVSDTGCGIAPEYLDRIFDKLFQIRETDTSIVGGIGLGLYIANGIVRLHGGRMWAESSVGHGSTFYFTLSRKRPPPFRRILLIDEDPSVQRMVRIVLEEAGFEVIVAGDGETALKMVEGQAVDMAIVDLCLPGMPGPVLLRELRKQWGDLPLLLYTGHPDSELMAQAMEVTPLTLLTKTCSSEKLVATVLNLLERRAKLDRRRKSAKALRAPE